MSASQNGGSISVRDAMEAIRFLITTEHKDGEMCDACAEALRLADSLSKHLDEAALAESSVAAALAGARRQ